MQDLGAENNHAEAASARDLGLPPLKHQKYARVKLSDIQIPSLRVGRSLLLGSNDPVALIIGKVGDSKSETPQVYGISSPTKAWVRGASLLAPALEGFSQP